MDKKTGKTEQKLEAMFPLGWSTAWGPSIVFGSRRAIRYDPS